MTDFHLTGCWTSANEYHELTDIPVIKSLRLIVASIIRKYRKDFIKYRTHTILSLGIGTGTLYKEFFPKEINEGYLKVVGIDSSSAMLQQCASDASVRVRIVNEIQIPQNAELTLVHKNIVEGFGLNDNSIDIVESVLVMHHIAYRDEIKKVLHDIFRVLKRGGIFVLADIDINIGGYIEEKEADLQKQYVRVKRMPMEGIFLCTDSEGNNYSIPVLDQKDENDLGIINNMMKEVFIPLKQEAQQYGSKSTLDAIDKELSSALRGEELNRSAGEWIEILEDCIGEKGYLELLTPKDIKRIYPEVLDKPFLIVATKR